MILGTLLLALVLGAALLFVKQPLWAGAVTWLLVLVALFGGPATLGSTWIWVLLLWAIPMVLLGPTPVRRSLVTPFVFKLVAPILPRMSETEKAALDAGTVWWDGELFSGAPDWKALSSISLCWAAATTWCCRLAPPFPTWPSRSSSDPASR